MCPYSGWRLLDAVLGMREGSSSAPLLVRKTPGNGHMLVSRALPETMTSFVFQETHGKDVFFLAVQILVSQFRLFGTFTLNNVNAGGSAVLIYQNLLPDGAICHSRDHLPRA